MYVLLAFVVVAALWIGFNLAWRWASRRWQIPCPALLAGMLEWRLSDWVAGTTPTLDRMRLRPGEQVLEIGPGPGRLLIPAARRVLPGGTVTGLELQPKMLARLEARAAREGITNLRAIQGDAVEPHFPPESFDVVYLATVLGEIPDRLAALRQVHSVLRADGRLAITELAGDPHYQSRAQLQRLAAESGFRLEAIEGNKLRFTATFRKA